MASATRLIPAPPNSDEKPFEIGDSITVFDAAMIYAGRHPHKVFMKDGSIDDHLKFLGAGVPEQPRSRHRVRARRSRDIYWELIARIKNRTITPIRPAYQHSGELDPINTVIRTADLANIAEERGEQPKYLTKYLRLKTSPVMQRQRRGPAPGTVNRYGDADRKLFPKMKRLMRERRITASAAAAKLAELNIVAGVGSKSSRAKGLAKRFLSETR